MNSLEIIVAFLAFCLILMLLILFVAILRSNSKLNLDDLAKPREDLSHKSHSARTFNGYGAVIPAYRQMYGSNDLSMSQYRFTENKDIERAFKQSLNSDGSEFRI